MTDFVKTDRDVQESIMIIRQRVLGELSEMYPNTVYDETDIFYSLEKFYLDSKTQFVIVIDEWDAVFRIRKEDEEGQKLYLD